MKDCADTPEIHRTKKISECQTSDKEEHDTDSHGMTSIANIHGFSVFFPFLAQKKMRDKYFGNLKYFIPLHNSTEIYLSIPWVAELQTIKQFGLAAILEIF